MAGGAFATSPGSNQVAVSYYPDMDFAKTIEMNRRFDEQLSQLVSSKGPNTQFFTSKSYKEMIQKVKLAKSKVTNKKPEDYQRLKRFDIMTIGDQETLIVPNKGSNVVRTYVHKDNVFQILHQTHLGAKHGGRTRMTKEINERYKNITREMIIIYLNLCEECEKKRNSSKEYLKPMNFLGSEMTSRCHIDLIYMPKQDQYKCILVYQDCQTKFVQLRPLKTDSSREVASVLVDIFTTFGAPCILHSHSREFASEIVRELTTQWPELKLVHGKARQSKDFEVIGEIKGLLASWLEENPSKMWWEGLRFVQLKKNTTDDAGMNCSPYEAMFGTKMKLGLRTSMTDEVLGDINTEEDLERLLAAGSGAIAPENIKIEFTEDTSPYSTGYSSP